MTELQLFGTLRAAALAWALGGRVVAAPGQASDAFTVLATPPAGGGVCLHDSGPRDAAARGAAARWRDRRLRIVSADSSRVRELVVDDNVADATTSCSDYAAHAPLRRGGTADHVGAYIAPDGRVVGSREHGVTPVPRGGPPQAALTEEEAARVRAFVVWMRTRCRA